MAGHIRCAKCQRQRKEDVCVCGEYKCFISLYWAGTHWRFWTYQADGHALDFERAARQLTQIRTQIDGKKFNPVEWSEGKIAERKFNVQVGAWLESRENDLKAGEIAPETYRLYKSYTKCHFTPFFKDKDVKDIDIEALKEFKDVIRKKELSLKVKRNILAILRVFLKWLKEERIISAVPEMPGIDGDISSPVVALDIDEQAERLKLLPLPERDVIEFMQETGLRPSEACALYVSDISLPKQEAIIRRTWSGHALKASTKGNHKDVIPLSDRAIQIAKKYLGGRIGDAFLFLNPRTGKGFRPRTIQACWSSIFKDIKLKNATRHSFCSQLVESGASQLEAMALMRHADIRSTLHYFKANTTKLRTIVNRRGKVAELPVTERVLNEF